jgi:biotin carboxyl carrier protein
VKHPLRHAMPVVVAVVAVVISALASGQRQPMPLAARTVAHITPIDSDAYRWEIPNEARGRVMRWDNDRLVASEAAAVAAEAARIAADQAAQAAQAAALAQRARAAATARTAPAAQAPPAATTIPSYAPGTVQDIITKAFTPLGATAVAWGLRVAKCESGYNPRAYNGAGPYLGLFQFLLSTFRATPFGGQDPYDPVANAGAAAWKYSQGGAGAWGCK